MLDQILRGAAAGAAGTTALNAATYLDMAVRGRPASSTPEDTIERLSDVLGAAVPGNDDARSARLTALGALTGIVAGVSSGAVYGALRAVGLRPGPALGTVTVTVLVLLAGNGPMTVLGVTDPRSWPLSSWAADVLPHLAYGVVTATVLDALER